MARNRRSQSWAERFGPALKALLVCALIGSAGLGYVWQKNQIHQLGQQYRKLEGRLDLLRRQNKALSDNLAAFCLPRALEARIRQSNLGLVAPEPSQVVRLVLAPVVTAQTTAEPQLVQKRSDMANLH